MYMYIHTLVIYSVDITMCLINIHTGYTYFILLVKYSFGSRLMSHDAHIGPPQLDLDAALSACSYNAHMMQAGLKEMLHKQHAQMDLKVSSEP